MDCVSSLVFVEKWLTIPHPILLKTWPPESQHFRLRMWRLGGKGYGTVLKRNGGIPGGFSPPASGNWLNDHHRIQVLLYLLLGLRITCWVLEAAGVVLTRVMMWFRVILYQVAICPIFWLIHAQWLHLQELAKAKCQQMLASKLRFKQKCPALFGWFPMFLRWTNNSSKIHQANRCEARWMWSLWRWLLELLGCIWWEGVPSSGT